MMGNPNAKVKLIEIGRSSCPHCKKFEDEGAPTLIDKYVKPGKVSWEFRPYLIHGPIDMAADSDRATATAARPSSRSSQALYKDQAGVDGQGRSDAQDKVAQIQNLPTNQLFVAMASLLGLQDWAAARGVPQAKSNQCLSDQKMIDQEVQVTSDVNNQYPDFKGTPSFVINGNMLKHTAELGEAPAAAGRSAEVMRSRQLSPPPLRWLLSAERRRPRPHTATGARRPRRRTGRAR